MEVIGNQLPAPQAGWKRFNSISPEISYKGVWTKYDSTSASYGFTDNVGKYSLRANDTMTFNFTGKKLLLKAYGNSDTSGFLLTIDGVSSYVKTVYSKVSTVVVYEKEDLAEGYHAVEIKVQSSSTFGGSTTTRLLFDSIDIDENGELLGTKATVGSELTAPEAGWKRYDETSIESKGTGWTRTVNAGCWNGSILENQTPTSENVFNFRFYGTKLRLIDYKTASRGDRTITIDGVSFVYNCTSSTQITQALVYEKTDLQLGYHDIKISSSSGSWFSLDSIDIDSTGRLFHPDEVTNVSELTVGKRIRCNYVATSSGKNGVISNLGKETSDMQTIPTSTPNVDLYFIMVDEYNGKKILVADRNIQSSISWDALNSEGLIFGVQKSLNDSRFKFILRAMSGGINSTDKDNEWDEYIVNSTLNGKISASDNNVWNWSGGYSWTSSTNTYASTSRTVRGYTKVNFSTNTTSNNVAHGFRPVLEIEILPMNRSFINYERLYKKYAPKTYIESGENVIPVMTSNTTPSGIASASSINSTSFDAYQAFNGIQDERYGWASLTPVSWLQYQFPIKKIIYKYSISMRTNSTYYASGEPPKSWTFEGSNDGVNWNILDNQTNNTTLARGVIEEYRINNSKAFTYYRINISANQGNGTITVIAELKMFEKTTVSDAGWKSISATLPSEDTFINDGMGDLSILDRKNEHFVVSMSANGSLGSGKIFKGSVDLKKYFELTSISVK